jgi:hypothetical protein
MNYLSRFEQLWRRIFPRPEPFPRVQPHEPLSRFVLSKRLLKQSRSRVSPQVFAPSTKTKITSIYRILGCSEEEIWAIGDRYVTDLHPEHKPVLARADLEAEKVTKIGLKIIPCPRPHPRHADVTEWPQEEHLALMKATALANSSVLISRH